MKSEWCRIEFAVAIRAPRRVIIIILGNDRYITKLNSEAKQLLTMTTYIKWNNDEASFKKLTNALLYDVNHTDDANDVLPAQQADTPSALIATIETNESIV